MRRESVFVSDSVIAKIMKHASCAYPKECCGLIFTKGESAGIEEAQQMDEYGNTGCHFEMDPVKLLEKERQFRRMGYEIAGFYHSHPDREAILSEEDEELMIPGMIYLIVPVSGGHCRTCKAWTVHV